MNKTKILALLTILFAAIMYTGAAHAIDYSVSSHTIDVQIGTGGQDTVEEKFFVNFPNDANKISFREKSSQLSTGIDAWKEFNPLFAPSLGENITSKKIAYNEGELNYLQISYTLNEPLMAVGKEATMLTEYDLKVNYFNSFYQSGLWIIPENTKISIELPAGAEIKDTIEPLATITNNGTRKIVNWDGYKSANKIVLNYILWKKIEPVIDLNAFSNFLFKTQTGLGIVAAIIVILGIIFWQRKKIGENIEGFVEKNSQIKEEQ